eukprot:10306281-Ditylum_brightwellii.AAC.1
MYAVEIVEGKDRPREIGKSEFHAEGNTASLLLCLTRNLFGTGKLVILDSGFCVLQAITALKKFGVYASALINKRIYWSKHTDGPGIQNTWLTRTLVIRHVFQENLMVLALIFLL